MTGMICAEGEAADSCSGDSGGPLLYYSQDGQVYVVGIVSWGATTSQCTTSRDVTQPGVYASVAAYQAWIQDKVDKYGQFVSATPIPTPTPTPIPASIPTPTLAPTTRDRIEGEDCSTTIGGCKCIDECASRGYPRLWCEVDEQDECMSFYDRDLDLFYDYCDKGCGTDATSKLQGDCSITLGSCECEDDCSLGFDGKAYCNVGRTCNEALFDQVTKLVYDYCGKGCQERDCSMTLSGCQCSDYCSSAGGDPNGNWCYINQESCDTDLLEDWQRDRNQFWDYCVQGCRGVSKGEECNDGCICEPQYNRRGDLLQDFCLLPNEFDSQLIGDEVDLSQPYCKVVNPSECGKTYINCNYNC
eukprot:TRINITY_DN13099_c0_g2_i6.p2 TRINITY_DN13099_c0_g2~~TRINITY_DN13099_c0_g2_i6.p2  ORF type:complete len:358 (-),score=39.81 TRINITY_DN13099_c0_g2_i6:264-1337(-)